MPKYFHNGNLHTKIIEFKELLLQYFFFHRITFFTKPKIVPSVGKITPNVYCILAGTKSGVVSVQNSNRSHEDNLNKFID